MRHDAFINRIAVEVPPHDVHDLFLRFARSLLSQGRRKFALFERMAERSGIAHRYSFIQPAADGSAMDASGFYRAGNFPDTAARMKMYERCAPELAERAVKKLLTPEERAGITHLLVSSCTGLAAPGIDLELVHRAGLPPNVERSVLGFMGCYAAINGLKLARHIVRSQPEARVLALNLELCSLHLHDTEDLDEILSFLLFGDGCAAALVSADPKGVLMEDFHAALVPGTADLIRWNIRNQGFDMVLSGKVPAAIRAGLEGARPEILRNRRSDDIALWAVHPGGRTVLDAVEASFALAKDRLAHSRQVLNDYGNMSSGTVMFVLDRMMRAGEKGTGLAMAFGPGLVAETMRFQMAA